MELYPLFVWAFLSSDMNECDSNPCTNGTTCVDGINGYNCTCAAGYTGDRCETGRFERFSNAYGNRKILSSIICFINSSTELYSQYTTINSQYSKASKRACVCVCK